MPGISTSPRVEPTRGLGSSVGNGCSNGIARPIKVRASAAKIQRNRRIRDWIFCTPLRAEVEFTKFVFESMEKAELDFVRIQMGKDAFKAEPPASGYRSRFVR